MGTVSDMQDTGQDAVGGALDAIAQDVRGTAHPNDMVYFPEHRDRYLRTLARIRALSPPGGRILDVGSHFLHLAGALRLLGFQPDGMDVSVFSQSDLVRNRADRYGIENHCVDDLQSGAFLPGVEGYYDLVIFTEIIEHITFNPVLFWRRIYQMLKVGGVIYITTPNALTPWKMLAIIKNALTLRGTGLPVRKIFDTITYGHHWKEYSGREMREYFKILTPDFDVNVSYFNVDSESRGSRRRSLRTAAQRFVERGAGVVPAFRDQIEVVVRLDRRTAWTVSPPRISS